MSITCQYEQLSYPFFVGDLTRRINIEAKLEITADLPRLKKIIHGDFQLNTPIINILENSLVVTGRVFPHILYLSESVERVRNEEVEAEGSENYYYPQEFGIGWYGDNGISYEEKIDIQGLRPGMNVQVEVSALVGNFERIGIDQVLFKGLLEITIHSSYQQTAGVISNIDLQAHEKINLVKDRVMVEDLLGVKKVTLPVQSNLVISSLKPGISRILKVLVKPAGISQEVSKNRVHIKGLLEISVIYVGTDDEGNPTDIFVNDWNREYGSAVSFETYVDIEADGEIIAIPRIMAQNMVIEPKNTHELSLLANLQCEIELSRLYHKEMVVDATAEEEIIDIQKHLLNLEEYSGEISGEIALDLEIDLPSGFDGIDRILTFHGMPRDVMAEASDNKVLIEGNLDLWLMYINDSAKEERVTVVTWDKLNNSGLPLTGILEYLDLQPGTLLRTQIMLDSLHLELIDSRKLKLSGIVRARIFSRTPRAIFVLRDCAVVIPVDYSTRPSMLFYVVQPGDTLWKIARRYQTTVDTLVKVNQITNPDYLEVGQKLIIPKRIVNM